MSQMVLDYISLEQLVKDSSLILVVERCTPETTVLPIKIGEDEEKYPPYHKISYHFSVIEILYAGGRTVVDGNRLEVLEANWHFLLNLHKGYYLDGMRRSPLISSYDSPATTLENARIIVFLRQNAEKELEFTVANSIESILKRDEVLRLIKELKK